MKFLRSSWGLVRAVPPNRWAVYLVGFVSLVTALSPLFIQYDMQQVAVVLGALAAFATAIVKWLTGWQQMEKVSQQNTLHELVTTREAAAAAEARAQATAPRSNIKYPR